MVDRKRAREGNLWFCKIKFKVIEECNTSPLLRKELSIKETVCCNTEKKWSWAINPLNYPTPSACSQKCNNIRSYLYIYIYISVLKNIEHMNINVLDEGNLTLPTHNQPRNRREL